MRTVDARKIYLLLLLAGFLINVSLIFYVWKKNYVQTEISGRNRVHRFLDKLHASFSLEKIYSGRLKKLFELSAGKEGKELERVSAEWIEGSFLPSAAFEIVFFNGHEPLNVPDKDREEWKFLFSHADCRRFKKFRIADEDKNRLIKFLGGGVAFERLEGKPGQLRRLGIGNRRSYGIWFSDPDKYSSGANGMLVLIHAAYVCDGILAKSLFRELKIDVRRFGFLNLFASDNSLLPADINTKELVRQLNNIDIKSGFTQLKVAQHNLLVSYKPDGRVFLAVDRALTPPLPFWTWGLFFFWVPGWLYAYVNAEARFKLSLRALLSFVLLVSMASPTLAIALYWNNFLESSLESMKIAEIEKLQQYLLQLDAGYQEIFRVSRDEFRRLVKIIDGHPEKMQAFIDCSVRLEVDGMFDSCMVIDSEGRFVRPYAGSSYAVRSLVFYNRAYREKMLEQFFAHGWVPFDLEADYALNTPSENLDIKEFVSLMPSQGKQAFSSFARFTGRDIIRLYNEKQGIVTGLSAAQEQVSSMVMSSFVGNDDENPVACIQQSFGDYFDFGLGNNKSINFVDVIRDEQGAARYCVILFSGYYNYSRRFFNKIFRNRDRWPEGIKFMAVSERLFYVNYPRLDLWARMHRLVAMMQAPRNMHSEECRINGESHLLCAYAGKKCDGYILVAAVPLKEINKKLELLKTNMLRGAIIVLATLVFVVIRLKDMVVTPARKVMDGVRAMENRDHSHRILIESGDEWQNLAETFNDSLESMKELEIAHFVQTCILHDGEIASGSAVFAGRSVSADDVGGDYYDAFVLAENEMLFVIGDVSGHSVSAALVVAMARAAFAALVDSGVRKPDELFLCFNQLMLEHLRRVKMMTCFAGYIDKNGILTCCNAGQTFPLLIKTDGSIEALKTIGYPLGTARRKAFNTLNIALPEQCRLVMFSDGLVEAVNDGGEQFGYERVEAMITRLGCYTSREDFFAAVYGELKEFSGPVPWNDDVTVALFDYRKS